MKTKTVYVIKYNDCYGNGDNTSIEGVIENQEDFPKWLEEHNKAREDGDNTLPESEEEFDIITTTMYTF